MIRFVIRSVLLMIILVTISVLSWMSLKRTSETAAEDIFNYCVEKGMNTVLSTDSGFLTTEVKVRCEKPR